MAKMYITLAVLCFCGSVLVEALDNWDEAATLVKATLEDCKGPIGASDADVAEILERKPASTKEGKCLRSCLVSNLRFRVSVDAENNVIGAAVSSPDKPIDIINIEHALDVIKTCYDMNASGDSCDLADEQFNCMFKEAKAYWP